MTTFLIKPIYTSYDDWVETGKQLANSKREFTLFYNFSVGWWICDGESNWGEMYSQALDLFDEPYITLASYKRVAERYTPEDVKRFSDLTWTHFRYAAGSVIRLQLLEKAQIERMPARALLPDNVEENDYTPSTSPRLVANSMAVDLRFVSARDRLDSILAKCDETNEVYTDLLELKETLDSSIATTGLVELFDAYQRRDYKALVDILETIYGQWADPVTN